MLKALLNSLGINQPADLIALGITDKSVLSNISDAM